MHPVVTGAIARIAPGFGRVPVRIPVEPFRLSYAATADQPVARLTTWLFYFAQTRRMRRTLSAASLPLNDHVFGVNDSGAMVEARMLEFLDHLPEGVSELYCHPATQRWEGIDNLPPNYRPIEEFAALVSPDVNAEVETIKGRLVSFRDATQDFGRA
jgi:chitin disaccharide deacetylase